MAEADRIAAEFARRDAAITPDRYSPADPTQLLFRQSRERAVLAALRRVRRLPLSGQWILDVGCGSGQWLADLETWGADRTRLAGIDLVPRRLDAAHARLTPGADLRAGDASTMPWPSGRFDIVLQSTVFSSILDPAMCEAVAAEMTRVVARDGLILWSDFFISSSSNRAGARHAPSRDHATVPRLRRRAAPHHPRPTACAAGSPP